MGCTSEYTGAGTSYPTADQRSASDWQSDRYVMARAPKAVSEVNSGVYATLAGLISSLAWWEVMI